MAQADRPHCGDMALTGITLNFLDLQYARGAAVQYLGFRTLRRGERSGWRGYCRSCGWCGMPCGSYLSASPWMPEGTLSYALGLVGMAVQIVQLLALRAGAARRARWSSRATRWARRSSTADRGAGAFAAVANWLAVIPMLIAFGLIIRSLVRVGSSLGSAGYCFRMRPCGWAAA